MSKALGARLEAAGDVNWDAILDNAFQMGKYSRVTRVNDWTIITGMQVKYPEVLQQVPNSSKVLVLADTITVGSQNQQRLELIAGSSLLLMGRVVDPYDGSYFTFVDPTRSRGWEIYLGILAPDRRGIDKLFIRWGNRDIPNVISDYEWMKWYQDRPGRSLGSALKKITSLPLEPCRAFFLRMQVAALSLINDRKPELASELLGKLQQILSLFPKDSFSDLQVQATANLELMQPLRPATDFVPYLSSDWYAGMAQTYGPALKAYADNFTNFMNRRFELENWEQAAALALGEKEHANTFQALVSKQLEENLNSANQNIAKATASLRSQEEAIKKAKRAFDAGLSKWEDEKKQEAALAIAGAAIEFVSGIASIFAGNPKGAADAAKAAAEAAKTASTIAKLMQQLVTIGKVIAKVAALSVAVYKAATQIRDAKNLADQMTQLTLGANDPDMAEAPSAGAYWDRLWLEVEAALADVIKEGIEGANEYLKELKVLVIYGRALTTAQATLLPLTQEIARAALQAEIAKKQRASVEKQISQLQDREAATTEAVAFLFMRYKTVQRSMLVALQNFDSAYTYWALSNAPVARDLSRPIGDVAGDLLETANIKKRQQDALNAFRPPPQPFQKKAYKVPQAAIDEFLKTRKLVLRFSPLSSPMTGWGRVGRVRVHEIYVWVEWREGKRPAEGSVEFTVRTNGIYADQLVSGQGADRKVESFCFVATPLNFSFRYDLEGYSNDRRYDKIIVHGAVAQDFRAEYFDPTMFTEWLLSLPEGDDGKSGTLDLAALASAMNGITVEFSGTFIKDGDRFA